MKTLNGYSKERFTDDYVLLAGYGTKSVSDFLLSSGGTISYLNVTGAATFSQAINGSILGNAATASRLQNARTINGVAFDGSANITVTASASDVYPWAKASSKPSYAFNEITPGAAIIGDGANYLALRSHASWRTGMYYHTTGQEALVFGHTNAATSFIFATTDPASRTNWTSLSPHMQIKQGCVYINSLIPDYTTPSYNLYVNGNANITGALTVDDLTVGNMVVTGGTSFAQGITSSGIIQRASGGMWIKGRDNVVVKNSTPGGSNTFIPIGGSNSKDGFWALGTLGDTNNFYLEFTSNTNYSGSGNQSYRITFPAPSNLNGDYADTVAFTSNLSSYLKADGTVTATGMINLLASQYTEATTLADTTAALNLQNSNIKGVNAIYFADTSNEINEGIHFVNPTLGVDTLLSYQGVLYYRRQRALGTTKNNAPSTSSNIILHTGNSSVNTTNRTVNIGGTSITVPPPSEFDSVEPLYINSDNDSTNNGSNDNNCAQLNVNSKVGGYQLTKTGYSTLYRQTSAYSITTIFARDLFFNISSTYLQLLIPYTSIPLGVYNIYVNKGIVFRFIYGNGRSYPRSLTVHYLAPGNSSGSITTTTYTQSSSTPIQRINFSSSDCWFNGTPLIYPDYNSADAYAVSLNFGTAKNRMWRMFVLSHGDGVGTSSTPAEICIYPMYCY